LTKKENKEQKIAIVGAGFVGSTFAYSLLIHGTVPQIVLIDINRNRAIGEAMDLEHSVPFAYPTKIWSGSYEDCIDADVVVIAVDKGQKLGQSRLDLAGGNFEIMKSIVGNIIDQNKDCLLLVVSNPLDVMTYAALKLSGFPRNRVIGSGTTLDTARLRYVLGEYLEVDPRNVHAYIIGEHGDSEVPVWSLANVAGIRLKEFCPFCGKVYDPEVLNELFAKVRKAGIEISQLKGHTNYAVALGMTKIVESILRDENAVTTVSTLLEDYHGISDICLSVPVVLDKNGVKEVIKIPLDDHERQQFENSAAIIRKVNNSLGL
jgi:L-lactate dehydrogenase